MPKTELTATTVVPIIRALKFSFLLIGFLLIFLAYKLPSQNESAADATVEFMISAVAFVDVALGFFLPSYLMRQARRTPRDRVLTTPVQRWMMYSVMSLALFQSCNLLALFLHLFSASPTVVVILFVVGMCSITIWDPGKPPLEAKGSLSAR